LNGGSVQRQKLLAEVIDMARRVTDKDLQVAVQVLGAIASGMARGMRKAKELPQRFPQSGE